MAPSRGKGKTRASSARSALARSTHSTRTTRIAVPDVYEEMLAEEAKRSLQDDVPERPFKRRRVAAEVRIPPVKPSTGQGNASPASRPVPRRRESMARGKARAKPVQTIEASSEDDLEDESEFDFEDVDLNQPTTLGPPPAPPDDDDLADVSISVDPSTRVKPAMQTRRKPASSAEKALRLLTHKAHVLCLIGHCMYVNTWCNDINVQQHLHPLLSKKALANIQGKKEYTQFQRDRSFREGLELASEMFRGHFKVNASGMKRSMWKVDGEETQTDSEVDSISRQDLIRSAREMEGSQDVGNQLFCALLRSAGIDARLVCSIQPLPLNTSQARILTPQKPSKPIIRAMPPYGDPTTSDSNTEENAVKTSSTIGKVPSARRRLGQPSLNSDKVASSSAAPPIKKKPVRKLDYPIFWVEAFNTAHQKWTPVDPLVTRTIGKPSKFEPPSSYALNQMSYVIAFDDDGVARDVTRRYTKAYNAKTRRHRVESTENGMQWFQKALRLFRRRGGALDREQTEDAELNQKEVREGLPGNVQDFKDHPVYALERHLKRHEIIQPKREVGKVNAGAAARPRMEPVYRRSDVLICRSGDKWYRFGRVIQEGQAPIKHVPARNLRRGRSLDLGDDGEEAAGADLTALYAHHQTGAYVSPPVVKGKVPRNAFGNLDIYVPSMVPPGGTHIRHALAQQAARILRVDYADAVTGFQFKGRHGTAIVQGAIVAAEYAEVVEAVIDGLLSEQLEEESLARSAVALRMWKRFLTGLRIKERVSAYGTDDVAGDVREQIDRQVEEQDEIAEAGGFFAEEPAMPTAGKFSLVEMARVAKQKQLPVKKGRKAGKDTESEDEADFSGTESADEATVVPPRRSKRASRTVVREHDEEDEDADGIAGRSGLRAAHVDGAMDDNGGGGFLPQDGEDEYAAGGFVLQGGEGRQGDGAGGFVVGDNDGENDRGGGGFLPEQADESTAVQGSGGEFWPDDLDQAGQPGGFVADEPLDTDAADSRPKASGPMDLSVQDHGLVSVEQGTVHVFEAENENMSSRKGRTNENPSTADAALSMHGALPDEQEGRSPTPVATDIDGDAGPQDGRGDSSQRELVWGEEMEEDEESGRGSMISHDPEDEDAEPDWLESD